MFTQGNSSSTSPDFSTGSPQPFTPEADDLLVYVYIGDGVSSGDPTFVVPSGFTEVMSQDGGFGANNSSIGYKVSDGTEASVTFDGGVNNHAAGVIRFVCCIRNAEWVGQTIGASVSSQSHAGTGEAGRLAVATVFQATSDPNLGNIGGGSASLDAFHWNEHAQVAMAIAVDPDATTESFTTSRTVTRLLVAEVHVT